MSYKRITLGKFGEKAASDYLQRKGYTVLQTNFRTRLGEIDVIAKDRDTLVFIEVKTRKSKLYDSPLSAITPQKQRHISMVALEYLSKHNLFNTPARFDAVAITLGGENSPQIEHIENAFELSWGH